MNWKTIAIKSIPEDQSFINDCENPFDFWVDIYQEYTASIKKNEFDKPKRIVELALSCISDEEKIATKMGQATLISFFHDIAIYEEQWKYIPQFFNILEHQVLSKEFQTVLNIIGYNKFLNEINKNT